MYTPLSVLAALKMMREGELGVEPPYLELFMVRVVVAPLAVFCQDTLVTAGFPVTVHGMTPVVPVVKPKADWLMVAVGVAIKVNFLQNYNKQKKCIYCTW